MAFRYIIVIESLEWSKYQNNMLNFETLGSITDLELEN